MLFTVVKTALLAAPLPYCSQAAAPSCTGYACETTWGRTNGKERLTGVRSDAATAAHCSDVALRILGPLFYAFEASSSRSVRASSARRHTWKTRREKDQIEPSRQAVACALENPRASSQRLEPGPLRRLLQGVRQPRAHGTDRARHRATTCHGARHRATTTPVARPQRPSPDEA